MRAALLAVALGVTLSPSPSAPASDGYWGFAVGVHPAEAARQRFRFPPAMGDLRRAGARDVLITPALRVAHVRSSTVVMTDVVDHLAVARRARRLGMGVVWMPTVHLDRGGPEDWRGALDPAEADRFWRTYGAAIGRHAAIARRIGARLFVVGSELTSLSGAEHRARWARVAARARRSYDGPLAFGLNHDALDRRAPLAAVDVVGVSAYFPVRRSPRDAWRHAAERLRKLRAEVGKPLVILEAGCPSRVGAWAAPWDDTVATPVDHEAQRAYYAGMREELAGADWLDGLFVWKAFGPGGPHDRSYTPFGKPAIREAAALLGR